MPKGLSFKKAAVTAEQDRPEVARRRARWKKHQGRIDPARLVFIDETWTKTNMGPLRGWKAPGRRLIGKAPHGHWRTLTFLAALRCDRIEAPCVFDGPIKGTRFLAYVQAFLLPTLKPGDIVVMDNVGSHKGKAVRQAIGTFGWCAKHRTSLARKRFGRIAKSPISDCDTDFTLRSLAAFLATCGVKKVRHNSGVLWQFPPLPEIRAKFLELNPWPDAFTPGNGEWVRPVEFP